jgi:hypothetical protein
LEAIASYLIACTLCSTKYEDQLYRFKEKLANTAYKNNYQGKWELLQELLEQSPHYLGIIAKTVTSNFSSEDIYGNLIPLMKKMCKLMKLRRKRNKRIRIRKPQRKRGYNDKGSCRFSHEIHQAWTFTGPNPERLDKRHRISAPTRPQFWRRSE